MKKTDWQYLIDTLLFICVAGIAFIGIAMKFFLPAGAGAQGRVKYFLGLHRHQWGDIHFYLSAAFTVLVIIHLTLNWKWIKSKARQFFKGGWGVALAFTVVAAFLVLFLFWLALPKNAEAYRDYGVRAGERSRDLRTEEKLPVIPKEKAKTGETKTEAARTEHEAEDAHSREAGGLVMTGQMTLLDIQRETGIPAGKIAAELGLPPGVSHDETLGRLRKKYGFTMEQVRVAVLKSSRK